MAPWYKEVAVETQHRTEMRNVTGALQACLKDSGIQDGLLVAQVLHTTAGLTINENADPDVVRDLLDQLDRLAARPDYRHAEGNSDAHLKASLMGASVTVPIVQGRMALGTWQGIYFCEFDGPRSRRMAVKIIAG